MNGERQAFSFGDFHTPQSHGANRQSVDLWHHRFNTGTYALVVHLQCGSLADQNLGGVNLHLPESQRRLVDLERERAVFQDGSCHLE